MNKIEAELQKATDCEPKKGEDRVDYLVRLMKAIAGLSEKEWDKLSAESQAWYNTNADKPAANNSEVKSATAAKDSVAPAKYDANKPVADAME